MQVFSAPAWKRNGLTWRAIRGAIPLEITKKTALLLVFETSSKSIAFRLFFCFTTKRNSRYAGELVVTYEVLIDKLGQTPTSFNAGARKTSFLTATMLVSPPSPLPRRKRHFISCFESIQTTYHSFVYSLSPKMINIFGVPIWFLIYACRAKPFFKQNWKLIKIHF